MKLSDYTDYSLRVLLYVAVRGAGTSKIKDIAAAYGISKNHLMKIVQQLGDQGWIETVRGRNGGLRLASRTLGLTIGDVVRLTEGDFALAPCVPDRHGNRRVCVIAAHCGLLRALEAAHRAFLDELDRHTVGELSQPQNSLAELLGVGVYISLVVVATAPEPKPRSAAPRPAA
ncbi:Rrf2 family transcriptional regulator [Burkholderia sp. SRS-W-2-2016]|uniref:RrF2 family transcriptional regulator n=1 Tax=Burkholderia sp. SRS-W-2-2016 TaxID=1926878 RepID=UPI00094B3BBC|nr:Rrf2 family transcriptional regulator [Burkholderia sp. SRS-W-2-2016]OLL28984.1 Rrf2 family transcriptional regulator [Burkholderia sp. SRS-W-2-2016]